MEGLNKIVVHIIHRSPLELKKLCALFWGKISFCDAPFRNKHIVLVRDAIVRKIVLHKAPVHKCLDGLLLAQRTWTRQRATCDSVAIYLFRCRKTKRCHTLHSSKR